MLKSELLHQWGGIVFGWLKRNAGNGSANGRLGIYDSASLGSGEPSHTVDDLISDFDSDSLKYLVRIIVDVCPTLIHQFYARLAFRVHLEDAAPPQFGIFDFSDEDAYWSIASGLSFDFDDKAFTEPLKKEFEAAVADFAVRLLRDNVKSINFTVNGLEYEGRSAA